MKRYEKVKICLTIDSSEDVRREIIEAGILSISDIVNRYKRKDIIVIETNSEDQKIYKVKDLGDIKYELTGKGEKNISQGLRKSLEMKSDLTFVFTSGDQTEDINSINKKDIPRFIMYVIPKESDQSKFNKTGFVISIEKGLEK